MSSFEFTGADPIDHFHLGRIEPGDVLAFDQDPPGGPWKATKRRPRRAQSAEQVLTSTEHGSDTPDPTEEG